MLLVEHVLSEELCLQVLFEEPMGGPYPNRAWEVIPPSRHKSENSPPVQAAWSRDPGNEGKRGLHEEGAGPT